MSVKIVNLNSSVEISSTSPCSSMRLNRAVANGLVGRVLARPIFASKETTPKKLTFATVLSFAKKQMFIAFLVFVYVFKKKLGGRSVYGNRDSSR